ncbi:hypothetical protein DZK26_09665 [Wenzhouxiangella sp. 15190]|nr:hypothetical protein DZK26_09665 [Wenzhouxiangella sp. 15190]
MPRWPEVVDEDGEAIMHWLARQSWCSGQVGMIGISWGGFNGLQIAECQPEPLKAITTACSTDDRYTDDIHYMGGCLLADNLSWTSTMYSHNALPPDPLLKKNWRHGSVNENYDRIRVPVTALYRLGRRLFQCGVSAHGQLEHAAHGAHRPLGAQVSAPGTSRTGHRFSFGSLALVGPLAQGHRKRHRTGAMLRTWMQDSAPPNPRRCAGVRQQDADRTD